jgi:pSer/pThr/pTyr-binding forkhead associated (FHA) protein
MAISESENELIRNAIINCTNNTTNNNSNINLNQMPKLDHDHAIIDTNGNVLTEIRVNSLTTGNNKIYTNEQLQQQSETITEDQSCLVIHANKGMNDY